MHNKTAFPSARVLNLDRNEAVADSAHDRSCSEHCGWSQGSLAEVLERIFPPAEAHNRDEALAVEVHNQNYGEDYG